MDAQDYLQDPCRASSLSFRKTNTTVIPEDLLILRDEEFEKSPSFGIDDPYFKLIHRMKQVERISLPEEFELIQCYAAAYADHIQECYDSVNISADILRKNEMAPGYDPGLRIAVSERNTKKIAASGIADLDPQIGEGVLDWIQVSSAYRRRHLGKFIVCELLHRLQGKADFVTVSGRVNNPCHPLELYKSCGFTDLTIWHIITKDAARRA